MHDSLRVRFLFCRQEDCQSIRRFLAERTTMWREPFWALLTGKEQLRLAQCVKLRIVAGDGEPHDVVAADSASGCLVFASLKGLAQVNKKKPRAWT